MQVQSERGRQRLEREGAGATCRESRQELRAEGGRCREAIKYRDFGGSLGRNRRYFLREYFLLKRAEKIWNSIQTLDYCSNSIKYTAALC